MSNKQLYNCFIYLFFRLIEFSLNFYYTKYYYDVVGVPTYIYTYSGIAYTCLQHNNVIEYNSVSERINNVGIQDDLYLFRQQFLVIRFVKTLFQLASVSYLSIIPFKLLCTLKYRDNGT